MGKLKWILIGTVVALALLGVYGYVHRDMFLLDDGDGFDDEDCFEDGDAGCLCDGCGEREVCSEGCPAFDEA